MTDQAAMALYCRACCGGYPVGQRACEMHCQLCGEWGFAYWAPARPLPGIKTETRKEQAK